MTDVGAGRRIVSDPLRFVTLVGIVFGLFWVVANPAWLGFDERTHLARAWGLAGGHIVTQSDLVAPDGTRADGDLVPAELFDDRSTYVAAVQATGLDNLYAGYGDLLSSRPGADERYEDTRPAMAAPVLAYVPSAAALVLVRAFDIPLLAGLWLARLANVAVYLGVVRWALGRASSHRWLLAAAALMPLNLYVGASLSPDGIVIAALVVVAALATRMLASDPLTRSDLVVTAVVFAAVKPPYVLAVALLPALAAVRSWAGSADAHGSGRGRVGSLAADPVVRATAGVTTVVGLAAAAWRLFAAPSYEPVSVFLEGDAFASDPDRQIDAALDDVGRFVLSVLHSSVLDLPEFLRRWMFGFGPFDLAPTMVGVAVFAVFLAGALAAHGAAPAPGGSPEEDDLPRGAARPARVVVALAVAGLWLALVGATYLYFTNGVPDSFQVPPRYSAPLVAVAVLLAGRRWSARLAAAVRPWAGQVAMVAALIVTSVRAVGVWRW